MPHPPPQPPPTESCGSGLIGQQQQQQQLLLLLQLHGSNNVNYNSINLSSARLEVCLAAIGTVN